MGVYLVLYQGELRGILNGCLISTVTGKVVGTVLMGVY